MYDAIVVGARCAGSSTAMHLARMGYKVLLTDRAIFPSDTISTHMVWSPGLAYLKRWGLLDAVANSNCPPIREIAFDMGEFVLQGGTPPVDGIDVHYCVRRTVLDKILVDAAARAGAEVREGFTVEGLILDEEHVIGVRGHSRDHTGSEERARVVIGADGQHSLVARSVNAAEYSPRPAYSCLYYSYWSGVRADTAEYHIGRGCGAGAFPTNDGLTCVIVAQGISQFSNFKTDVERNYEASLSIDARFAEKVRCGRREERITGTADIAGFFRKPFGPGWALVGDAGYHKDPVTAQGITDAFRDAETLAGALDDVFADRRPYDQALGDYERCRNEAVMPMYGLTCQFAQLDPPPDVLALMSVLRDNRTERERFFGAFTGSVPVPEFFSPENLARIMTAHA
jgi:flavin-dependent dehydrogenase